MLAYLFLPIFGLCFIIACLLALFKKNRPAKIKFAIGLLVMTLVCAGLIALEKPYRMFLAKRAIIQSKPMIVAIEKYKTEKGQYPGDLSELTPNYLSKLPSPSVSKHPRSSLPYFYQAKENTFDLQFRLDGTPFGYYFIYCVNDECPRFPHTLYLVDKIDGWGMYAKT